MDQLNQNGLQGQPVSFPGPGQGRTQGQGQGHGQGQGQGQNPTTVPAARNAAIIQLMKQEPYRSFIKPEQFTMANFGATNLSQDQLNAYQLGFTKLWENVFKHAREHPMHQQAVQRLTEASQKLYREYHRVKAGQMTSQPDQVSQQMNTIGQEERKDVKTVGGGNQQQKQPPNPQQSQQTKPQANQQPSVTQNPQQSNTQQASGQVAPIQNGQPRQPEMPPELKAVGDKVNWTLPIQMQEGTAEAQGWRAECTKRYSESIYKQKRSQQVIRDCDEFIQNARSNGADTTTVNERKAQYQKHLEEATAFVDKLISTEKRNQAARAQPRQGQQQSQPQQPQQPQQVQGTPTAPAQQNRQALNQVPTATGQQASRPQSSSSAQAMPSQSFPQTGGQAAQQQQQAQTASNYPVQRPGPQPVHANQQVPVQGNSTQSPQPLSHSQAIAASSRSYSTQQQNAPQSAQHFQQHRNSVSGDVDNRNPGQPIQKNWTPPPPQPVAMGASRPTLSGVNNGPVGAMGQPAIQKPDTFLLQGPGDRVLDKKKLDELVRQVCGADAGEGDALMPEVEESVLQIADEFIDNVVTSACKLAKLRGASTLEIRDIQLVLERQYNIRVPGYATDEVRTVRKTQPAQGYYQKMNAIQAAKVMGGKPDAEVLAVWQGKARQDRTWRNRFLYAGIERDGFWGDCKANSEDWICERDGPKVDEADGLEIARDNEHHKT